jgi:hypothetical protein
MAHSYGRFLPGEGNPAKKESGRDRSADFQGLTFDIFCSPRSYLSDFFCNTLVGQQHEATKMKTTRTPARSGLLAELCLRTCRRWAGAALLGLGLSQAGAQPAVTEAMSWSSTNCNGAWAAQNADFWELHNFGSNAVDLTGYLFCDRDALFPSAAWPLPALSIAGGETIIFFKRGNITPNEAAFRHWWGEARFPTNQQIIPYPEPGVGGYGFDENGDSVRLWDNHSNFVDRVDFDTARMGVTFTYDTNTGDFGVFSQAGVGGAWQAPCPNDVGSPGFVPSGPVPLQITRQPAPQQADVGAEVTFRIQASGLPRPRSYQWYFNGAPLSNAPPAGDVVPLLINYAGCGLAWKVAPGFSDLQLPNVQPAQAGDYFAVVTNGLQVLTSAVVRLTVRTNSGPPQIVSPAAELLFPPLGGHARTNLEISPWGTATLGVLAGGYPIPTNQWSWSADGRTFTDIPGATNRTLVLSYVQAGHSGIYRVRLRNKWGVTNAYAAVTVKPNPRLKITEAMSFPRGLQHWDWWELTNLEDQPLNLYGFRWDDTPGNIGGGPTITNDITIQPGESVIVMEGQTAPAFLRWWGPDNLPSNLQFITYTANGLSEIGDEVNVWRPSATSDSDFIDSVVFSIGAEGASFWFAPDDPCSEFGVTSVAGEGGAFQAVESLDVGSPGWTALTPPQVTSVRRVGTVVTIEWKAQPGSSNRVQYTHKLAGNGTVWADLGTYRFGGARGSATHTDPAHLNGCQCFYRVQKVASAPCPCEEKFRAQLIMSAGAQDP